MRFVQWLMFHRSAGRRLDDNSIVIGSDWHDGEDPDELNFRGGTYGRFLWTAGGVDYSRQYLPTSLSNLESPPELIVAHMDYVGIDKAVIQTDTPTVSSTTLSRTPYAGIRTGFGDSRWSMSRRLTNRVSCVC